jgi:hypothetical protein
LAAPETAKYLAAVATPVTLKRIVSRPDRIDANPADAIDRREALWRAALMLGGALAAPTIAGVLSGCDASTGWAAQAPAYALSPAQLELVATIAEHILPTTDTPGARAAGVHRFIDRMMAEYYSTSDRRRFVAGLGDVDERAKKANGNGFVKCTPAQQHAILTELDREAFSGARPPSHFFRTMKELTVVGYYTSQIGATKELRHVAVPGRFDGCAPVGRTWAV